MNGAEFARAVRSPDTLSLSQRADHHAHRSRRAFARARCGAARRTRIPAQAGVERSAARAPDRRVDGPRERWCGAATITGRSRASSPLTSRKRIATICGRTRLSNGLRPIRFSPDVPLSAVRGCARRQRERARDGLSPRHRPGHYLDPRHPVRCRAGAGRKRAAGDCRRSIRRPVWSSMIRRKSGRRPSRPSRAAHGQGAARRARDVAAIGITNQRETTSCGTAPPAGRSTMPSSGRTGAPPTHCAKLRQAAQKARSRPAPGSCSIRISRRPRSRGCSIIVDGARAPRKPAGWHSARSTVSCCGGSPAARCTRPTRPMQRARYCSTSGAASGTAACATCSACRRALLAGRARLRRRLRHDGAGAVRRADPHPGDGRRPAGGDRRAGLLRARHDEVDLWHRLLRAPQYRRAAGRVEQPPVDDHRLPARRQAHLRARRLDLHRRRGGAMAARRAQDHRERTGRERARRDRRAGRADLSGAGLCRVSARLGGTRRRAVPCSA